MLLLRQVGGGLTQRAPHTHQLRPPDRQPASPTTLHPPTHLPREQREGAGAVLAPLVRPKPFVAACGRERACAGAGSCGWVGACGEVDDGTPPTHLCS